jgi:catechol 2,3-dioxygenase-like lactoylglutathione lyase family enzyme
MNTKRISHIGVLVRDADAATRLWTEAFGFQKFADRRIEVEGIRSVFISVGGTWDEMVIEIMEPLDKSDMDNALSRRLARAGDEARGMTVLMRDPVDPGDSPRWLVHPKDANGVMVESVAR